MIYFDTSFLVSAYLADANSLRAKAYLSSVTEPLPFTTLHRLEMRNAFHLAVFQRRVEPDNSAAAIDDVENDIRRGQLRPTAVVWNEVFEQATLLSMHSLTLGCRSLDLLHVAAAKSLSADAFVTFDDRQRALANQAGLSIEPV